MVETSVITRDHTKILSLPEHVVQLRTRLQPLFPDRSFRLMSDNGSAAVLFEGDDGKAYKVNRKSGLAAYSLREAMNLAILGNEGVSPGLFEIVSEMNPEQIADAKRAYVFEGALSVRAGTHPLSVLVMEKLPYREDGLFRLPAEKFTREFTRIANILERHNLWIGDAELVLDKRSQHLKLLDAGGINRYEMHRHPHASTDIRHPTLSDEELRRAELFASLARLVTPVTIEDIGMRLRVGGLGGAVEYINSKRVRNA